MSNIRASCLWRSARCEVVERSPNTSLPPAWAIVKRAGQGGCELALGDGECVVYLLVALLLLDVTAALWQVPEPSEVILALRWLLPYESLAFALVTLMGIVWVVKGCLPRHRANEGQ